MPPLSDATNEPSHPSRCVFCNVTSENGFNIVAQNDKLIAFHDRNPACKVHILIISKDHHRSIKTLRREHIPLLTEMKVFAYDLLKSFGVQLDILKSWNLGFHIPPFNSINHLHLHVQALPYASALRRFKYRIAEGRGTHFKGLSWFVTLEQATSILEQDGRVGVLPC
ncbi:HIT-like domain-containing protein [Schizophyllum amplum]|uniref:HIT-like domain-containing protein n=1 Tax=Schizophyllum amplum TaxID=97359 RepID=A0A550CIL9_9AGAR|nr:HIT-like domain-containing protein [Auriculariopsis ampla]